MKPKMDYKRAVCFDRYCSQPYPEPTHTDITNMVEKSDEKDLEASASIIPANRANQSSAEGVFALDDGVQRQNRFVAPMWRLMERLDKVNQASSEGEDDTDRLSSALSPVALSVSWRMIDHTLAGEPW